MKEFIRMRLLKDVKWGDHRVDVGRKLKVEPDLYFQ